MKWILLSVGLGWLVVAIAAAISIGRAIHGGRKHINERKHKR